jgi:predicted porin
MKKSLIALAALGAFASAASAQSSVTLSGAIDLGVYRQNDQWNMQNSGSSHTNVTLSGTEDLGGGMRAFFYMNHRFNANTGAQRDANAFWRQSWVGLGGSSFGEVRMGKILPPLQDLNGNFEIGDGDGAGVRVASVHTGGLFAGNNNYGNRYANSIYYKSPNLAGLTVHAMIAAGDQNSDPTAAGLPTLSASGSTKPAGLGVDYAAGPLRIAAAYDRSADDRKTKGIYGSYNAGVANFMAQWEKGDTGPVGNPSATDVSRWSIGAKVPLGATILKAGYTKWSDEDVKKIGMGADYFLSKRTNLYAEFGKFSGNGRANSATYTGAATGPGALTDTSRKARFALGLWHRF